MTGRFVWHELSTTDDRAAIAFYTEVIGWRTEQFPESEEPYTMWVGGQGPLGGVTKLPSDAPAGVPPHWMGCVEVDDIDATVAQVKARGGAVHVPPTAVPMVGRFSVIADPHGATLSVLEPDPQEQKMPPHDPSKHGAFGWNELHAGDGEEAFAFYSALFGWTTMEEMPMGDAGTYRIYGQGDQAYGGMMTKMADTPAPVWIHYIHVDDLDAAIARATAKGGTKIMGPMEVPGGDRIAHFTDPQGAVFALHGPAKG
jgi:uncharacterized protein